MTGEVPTAACDPAHPPANSPPPKHLVLVVHGVGDPQPGWVVKNLAAGLLCTNREATVQAVEESVWVPELPDITPQYRECVSTHMQRCRANGKEVVFSEVYWADLSRAPSGVFGVVAAVFEIIFGLPNVVREALKVPENAKIRDRLAHGRMWCVGKLCNAVSRILLGPVAALNALMLGNLLLAVAGYAFNAPPEDDPTRAPSNTAVAGQPEQTQQEKEAEQAKQAAEQTRKKAEQSRKSDLLGRWLAPALCGVLWLLVSVRKLHRRGQWSQFWTGMRWMTMVVGLWGAGVTAVSLVKPDVFRGYPRVVDGKPPSANEQPVTPDALAKEPTPAGKVVHFALDHGQPGGYLWHGALAVTLMTVLIAVSTVLTLLATLVWASTYVWRKRTVRQGDEQQVGLFAWFRYPLHAGLVSTAMMVGLWGLFVPVIWTFVLKTVVPNLPLDLGSLPGNSEMLFQGSMPLIWFYAGMVLVFCLTVSLVWACRWWWAWKFVRDARGAENYGQDASHLPARLIANMGVVFVTVLLSVVGNLVFLLLVGMDLFPSLHETVRGWPLVGTVLTKAPDWSDGIVYVVTTVVGLGGSLVVTHMVVGLDVVLDVVNHFRYGYGPLVPGQTRPEERYYVRDAINDRFCRVLEEMLRRERPAEFSVVSHSQGTVVAIDNLNDPRVGRLLDKYGVGQVRLVTMGSPFEHLYQYYFPASYPTLKRSKSPGQRESDKWHELYERLNAERDSWVNVFRVDDFVGTHVLDPNAPGIKGKNPVTEFWEGEKPRNVAVGPRGHNNYWTDEEVLRELRTVLGVQPRPE